MSSIKCCPLANLMRLIFSFCVFALLLTRPVFVQSNEGTIPLGDFDIDDVRIEVLNCISGTECVFIPEILFQIPSEKSVSEVRKIHIRVDSAEWECLADQCKMELPETGEDGKWLEYWAMTADGTQGRHRKLRFRYLKNWQEDGKSYFELISDVYPDQGWPGSDIWFVFPSNEDLESKFLAPHLSPEELLTDCRLDLLCLQLINCGLVDISGCENFGLFFNGGVNGCGAMVCQEAVFQWQNQYNDELLESAQRHQVPARLLKGAIMQESQFWPVSDIDYEYGLGRITEYGADLLLRWNPVYYQKLCEEIFFAFPEFCGPGFALQEEKHQAMLRGGVLRKVGTKEEVDLLAAMFEASAFQVNALIQEVIEPGKESGATFDDLWKFSLANYHSGSGCLRNALWSVTRLGYPLTWENVKNQLNGICRGANDYVNRVYAYGNDPYMKQK